MILLCRVPVIKIPSILFGLLYVAGVTGQVQRQPVIVEPGAPGTPSKTLASSTRANKPIITTADVEFVQGMIMHHQQAVEMSALMALGTRNKQMLDLGKRISLSQTDEIKWMQHWLEVRGYPSSMPMPDHKMAGMAGMHHGTAAMLMMPGMLTTRQMEALRNAKDKEFDRLFLTGMIQHHAGALVMVKQLFDSPGAGQDGELFDFATDVDNTQRAEINLMERMLKENQ
jgi:uncharacterized protein (DUF305 family)